MHKKLILTSILAISVTGAAHATSHSGSFPNDGKMLENWTYINAANETNVGVDGGNVNALANYEWVYETIAAGSYLPQGEDLGAYSACTQGSFCPGGDNVHYDDTRDQGIIACSTLGDHSYTLSDTGSALNTDCYRMCSGNVTIPHATSIDGLDYYGTGVDTCVATECDTGYHLYPGFPTLEELINIGRAQDVGWLGADGDEGYNTDRYNITTNNTFVVDYNDDLIRGHGRCSSRAGVYPYDSVDSVYKIKPENIVSNLPDNTGKYCYCQLDGYTPFERELRSFSGPWVFAAELETPNNCATVCTETCASSLSAPDDEHHTKFIIAMFKTLGASNTCVINTYNITWADTLAADVTANEAATATYGGNINTPVKINPAVFQTTQKGKRFIGWTFGASKYDFSTLDYTIGGNSYTQSAANRTWATTFNYGVVSGVSLCSVTPGSFAHTGSPDETTTGDGTKYCWCRATGYTPAGENIVYENTSSSPWVYNRDYAGSASSCASNCADYCGYRVQDASDFRRAVFGITNN